MVRIQHRIVYFIMYIFPIATEIFRQEWCSFMYVYRSYCGIVCPQPFVWRKNPRGDKGILQILRGNIPAVCTHSAQLLQSLDDSTRRLHTRIISNGTFILTAIKRPQSALRSARNSDFDVPRLRERLAREFLHCYILCKVNSCQLTLTSSS